MITKYYGHWLQFPTKENGLHEEWIDKTVAKWLEFIAIDHKLPADTNEWHWEVKKIHEEWLDKAITKWLGFMAEDHKLPADTNEWPWEVKRQVILKLQDAALDFQTKQRRYTRS